jgi:hypothetical protein
MDRTGSAFGRKGSALASCYDRVPGFDCFGDYPQSADKNQSMAAIERNAL